MPANVAKALLALTCNNFWSDTSYKDKQNGDSKTKSIAVVKVHTINEVPTNTWLCHKDPTETTRKWTNKETTSRSRSHLSIQESENPKHH